MVVSVLFIGLPFGLFGQPVESLPPVNDKTIAQMMAKDSLVAQLVDSRRGYVFRIPKTAQIDSSRSGWNSEVLYEKRVYIIEGAGEFVITTTVQETTIPEGATTTPAYTWVERDSTTSAGTAWSRTYYLPTRRVQIEIIPYGIAMHPYLQEREHIFNSFRWKPGAETDAVDLDIQHNFPPPEVKPAKLGG